MKKKPKNAAKSIIGTIVVAIWVPLAMALALTLLLGCYLAIAYLLGITHEGPPGQPIHRMSKY